MGLTEKIKKRLVVGAMVGAAALSGGCNRVYTNALTRSLGNHALHEFVAGSVRNQVEGPRGVVVNNNSATSAGYPYITMRRWEDKDGNKMASRDEIFDEIGDSINLSNEGVYVGIRNRRGSLSTNYTTLDSNNNIVSNVNSSGGSIVFKGCFEAGNYTIISKQGNGITLSRKFKVRR